jgi:deoxyguanosine kinase
MDRDYIAELNQAYDAFFLSNERKTPVLTIDSNQLDFVRSEQDLDWIENRIRQQLHLPPFQPELPIDSLHSDQAE